MYLNLADKKLNKVEFFEKCFKLAYQNLNGKLALKPYFSLLFSETLSLTSANFASSQNKCFPEQFIL